MTPQADADLALCPDNVASEGYSAAARQVCIIVAIAQNVLYLIAPLFWVKALSLCFPATSWACCPAGSGSMQVYQSDKAGPAQC